MRKNIVFLLSIGFLIICVGACGTKSNKRQSDETMTNEGGLQAGIAIQETYFSNNWNKLNDKQSLSETEYNNLKLGKLSFIDKYGYLEYKIGNILIDDENKKLLTVKAIASEEISEYLLGYINNNITDSLLIAYEDVVEYYSTTSSIIVDNTIKVMTINRDYNGLEEISDTVKTTYIITDSLRFDEVIEN